MAESRRKVLLRVGVFGDNARAAHGTGGITVGELAAIHEFGTDAIPARPMLSGYIAERTDPLLKDLNRVAGAVLRGAETKASGLNKLGLRIVGEIKERISNRIDPPIADETIARKGSSVPLIDTGQLRNSFAHEVIS